MKQRAHYSYHETKKKTWLIAKAWLILILLSPFIIGGALALTSSNKQNSPTPPISTLDSTIPVESSGNSGSINSSEKQNIDNLLSQIKVNGFNSSSVDLYSSQNSEFYNQLSSPSSGFCSTGCHLYDSSGGFVTINCYSTLNSCSVYDSSGGYANVNCYSTLNSCSTSTSNGDYYNTHCYSTLNSCSTYGSNGYSSNTNCYSTLNSCSTYDSSGNYYNTHCYTTLNSCSTYGSNGYSSTTNCYSTLNSCSTYEW